MSELKLAGYAYSRDHGQILQRLLNLTTEASPQGPNEDERIPRPGLKPTYQWGTGPGRGLFRKAGSFGGQLFAVSGQAAFLAGVNVGAVLGNDLVRWAASGTQVVAVSSGSAYLYEGSGFNLITNPNLPMVSDVKYFGDRFVYSVLGSDRNYYSELNDAANIDGLSFFTSEASADPEVACEVLADDLFFFGVDTTEFWSLSDDPTAPFQRNTGSIYDRGCSARDTVCPPIDNALFWVGDDRSVYRSESVPKRVASHGVEDALRRCANIDDCTSWGQVVDAHALYVLNIPGISTFALDIQSGGWSEWGSYGRSTFRGKCAAAISGVVYVQDDETADIYTLDPGTFTDAGGPIQRVVSVFYPTNARFERCDRLSLVCSKGTGLASGLGSDPIVEMRFSDDQCNTFSAWRQGKIGKAGKYRSRVVWRGLGAMKSPGRYFEFRCSDPVLLVFQTAFLNEAGS